MVKWTVLSPLFIIALMQQVKNVGKVARAICIMSHPIPATSDSHSAQVILPQKQLGRKSDMYATAISCSEFISTSFCVV
jgi:Rab GDP dissociation inhibitor